jgi:hypothetical protein
VKLSVAARADPVYMVIESNDGQVIQGHHVTWTYISTYHAPRLGQEVVVDAETVVAFTLSTWLADHATQEARWAEHAAERARREAEAPPDAPPKKWWRPW